MLQYQLIMLHYWLVVLCYLVNCVTLLVHTVSRVVLTFVSPLQRPQLVVSRSHRVILMYVATTALTHSLTHFVTCLPPQNFTIRLSPPPQEEVKDNWDDVSGDEEAESVSDLV